MKEDESKCLIIVGMHRSGTSYTASVLKQSGLNIGDRLLAASIGNDLGHFENEDFYHFHQKAFTKRNYHSDGWSLNIVHDLDSDELKEARHIISINQLNQWGWKDPRTTLFLEAWKKLIPDAYFLFIYRTPWEVVESLFRRNTDKDLIAEPILTIENWQFYNEQILNFFNENKERSLLVEIENIMQRSSELIELLNSRLGFKLNAEVESIFDKNRFKNNLTETQQFFCESVFPACISLYKKLQDESSIKPLNVYKPTKGKMESLIKWWYDSCQTVRLNKEVAECARTVDDIKKINEELNTENTYLKNELSWIISSKWWRLRSFFKKLI